MQSESNNKQKEVNDHSNLYLIINMYLYDVRSIKHTVFWPPFILLVLATSVSLYDVDAFIDYVTLINDFILDKFGWLYALSTFSFVLLCLWVYFSPIKHKRIGGENAVPILTKWRWFSITLCTTIAIGILFWGTAEPIYHLHSPPESLNMDANTYSSAKFAISSLFMHWTITPYSIYTMAALLFALVYYNLKQPFSLGSMLYPLFNKKISAFWGNLINGVSLYSLVAGMAASLGAGMLTISGGLFYLFDIEETILLLGVIAIAIVLAFVVSSVSGLKKGIQKLSDLNIKFFILLAIFVFIFGPTLYFTKLGVHAIGDYIINFVPNSLQLNNLAGGEWMNDWTLFYWANWIAWTPVTAVFLGRIAYGYTVRDFIHFNLLLPAIFGGVWMIVFGGTALNIELENIANPLLKSLEANGPQSIIYHVFQSLPLSYIVSLFFLIVSFLSYVTAADSNTSAMSGLSSSGISPKSPEPPISMKIIWGFVVGVVAFIMVGFSGIKGVKLTSVLGGFPALFFLILVAFSLLKVSLQKNKI